MNLDGIIVDVIIPVYKPGEDLLTLIERLEKQTCPVNRLILINTEKVFFDEKKYLTYENVEVHHITKEEFDHAATRNMALHMSQADYVMFMTMDAVPADEFLVENLLKGFQQTGPKGEVVSVAYARQLPKENCEILEQFTRLYNYPDENRLKTLADLEKMGLMTFFCSDTCSMYHRDLYLKQGGFVEKAIFNEDMFYAAKSVDNGYAVSYCKDAKVYHSHNYGLKEQFRRNFDMGVSQAEHPEIFSRVKTESAGIQLVKRNALYLLHKGKWYLLPYLVISSGVKLMGYKFGTNYEKLSRKTVLRCTMNRYYWK